MFLKVIFFLLIYKCYDCMDIVLKPLFILQKTPPCSCLRLEKHKLKRQVCIAFVILYSINLEEKMTMI